MDQFERVEDLFQQASELQPAERGRFLTAETGADLPLRNRVEQLLRALDAAHANPGWEAGPGASFGEITGEIGRYRLKERIGAGGMGVVYKALRISEDIAQTVAIKILQGGAGDDAALQRFGKKERRILARLEHPNIARLLDGGTTADGLPFLVMEHVEGSPLMSYVSQAGLSLTDRLRLFHKICSAVAYTHQNLVAHRDLKPANVLVTASGEPKLLDFGVAALFDGSASRTLTREAALTPRYASPEQVRGESAGASSDIYTLGVLLYEMISGQLPYDAQASPLALATAITCQTPDSITFRGKPVDSDLEIIVLTALRKEPERRYPSVERFSADIQAFLDGYPISARPDSPGYRTWKFVIRHRAWAGALTIALLAIVGGAVVAIRQAAIANRRAEDVRRIAESVMIEANDAISELPGATNARQLLLSHSVQYLDKLPPEQHATREFALGLVDAYQKLALLQGVSQVNLGDRQGALETERKSEAILTSWLARSPLDVDVGRRLTDVYAQSAELMTVAGDIENAAVYARKAVDLAEKMAAQRPTDLNLQDAVANAYEGLGDVTGNPGYQNLGDAASAESFYRKDLAIRERVAQQDTANVDRKQPLAGAHTRLGKLYAMAFDGQQAALAEFSEAARLSEWIRANSPRNPWREMNVAIRNVNLMGPLSALGRMAEARRRGHEAVAILEEVLKADPKITALRRELAVAYAAHGRVESKAGDLAAALKWCKRSLGVFRELIALQPGYATDIGHRWAWHALAEVQLKMGDAPGALQSAAEQLAIDEHLLKVCPFNASASENQALATAQRGDAKRLAGHAAEASADYERALDILSAKQAGGRLTKVAALEIPRLRAQLARAPQVLLR